MEPVSVIYFFSSREEMEKKARNLAREIIKRVDKEILTEILELAKKEKE